MGVVVSKLSKNETPKNQSISNAYVFKRRVFEVQSPCQWLQHCYDGKCPSFQRINGNYYCIKKGIP